MSWKLPPDRLHRVGRDAEFLTELRRQPRLALHVVALGAVHRGSPALPLGRLPRDRSCFQSTLQSTVSVHPVRRSSKIKQVSPPACTGLSIGTRTGFEANGLLC